MADVLLLRELRDALRRGVPQHELYAAGFTLQQVKGQLLLMKAAKIPVAHPRTVERLVDSYAVGVDSFFTLPLHSTIRKRY